MRQQQLLTAVVLVALTACAMLASAQPSALLIHPTTHRWSVWTNGIDPGYPHWFQKSFDDSAWPTGYGLFGNDSNYPYPFQTLTPPPPVASRFFARTHFVWNGSPAGITLVGTNFVDDGAVVYLNGVEIYRFNMPAGPTTFETLAPSATVEPGVLPVRIALDALTNGQANPLVTGDNVIAVETASNSPFSSDTVWGMALYGGHVEPCPPPVIQPAAQSAAACRNVTFTAVDTNCPGTRFFQWYRNVGSGDEAMPGRTGPTLTIPSVAVSDAGSYFVRVTDSSGSFESARSTLRVAADTEGPRIFVASTFPDSDFINIYFDEPVDGSTAYDASTWSIRTTAADVVPPTVLSATADLSDVRQIRLTLDSALRPGVLYSYTTTQPVADACAGAVAPPGLTGPILQDTDLLHWADGRNWRYNQSGADQGTAWRAVNFDDSAWESGPQGFGRETSLFPDAPFSLQTPLSVGPERVTYYFRTRFRTPAVAGNLRFFAVVDDGAAVYVNGTEIGRINIRDDLVLNYNTFVDAVPEGQGYLPASGIVIPRNLLTAGENVLAIEVHQASPTSADVLLLARIVGGFDPVDPPAIAVQPTGLVITEGRNFTLSVVATPASAAYQWSKDDADIPGATSAAYAATAALNTGGSYRVRISNSVGSVTSLPATVIVRERILGYGVSWKYELTSQDPTLTGEPWFSPTFDDAAWPSGPGPLGFETNAATLARIPPLATVLPPTPEPRVTTYFRAAVTVPAIGAGESLYLTHLVDDGAAFYFDGRLAFVYNLAGGAPIQSDALAPTSTPGDGDAREVTVPIVLAPGTHTMAVEVHQSAPASLDFLFGAEISRGPALPALQVARESPHGVRLTWAPIAGVRLFAAPTADGPYWPVAITAPGEFVATGVEGLTARYFRLGY